MKFIEKLQKKPRSARLLILWLTTFLAMLIIIIIWLFGFSRDLAFKETEKENEAENFPSLFESIKKDLSIFKQGLEASLKSINLEINEQGKQE
ncbi:hypothetical protein ES703_46136 [subsurface metagenome]